MRAFLWPAMGLLLSLAGAGARERLVILSPHWEGIRKEYHRAFVEWYRQRTGQEIEVVWLDMGGTSDDEKYIRSQFAQKPEGIGIDLFWGGGVDPYIRLAEEGYFQPYRVPSSLLERIPADYAGLPMYDARFRWYGTALSGFGILYNRVVLRRLGLPEPQTWEDLARPCYFTWVGSADPRHSGSVHMMYEIILQAYGWERGWQVILGLGANARSFPEGSSRVPKDITVGEVAAGLVIDIYASRQMAEVGAEYLGFVMPEGQTVINPDGIGILRGAPNLAAARAFVEFVLSPEGQRIWMLPVGAPGGPREFLMARMSILPELYTLLGEQAVTRENPFQWRQSLRYDAEKGSTRWSLLNDLLGVLVIDPHDDLVRAWRAALRAGAGQEALEELGRVPLSEEEALRLAKAWKDERLRNRVLGEWAAFAAEKHRRLLERYAPHWQGQERVYGALRLFFPLLLGLVLLGELVRALGGWLLR